jgi:hypothetical protein
MDLVKFFNLQFMHRYIQGFLPISFNEVWLTNAARQVQDTLPRVLRNSENLNIPFARLATTIKQPLVNLPKLWTLFDNAEIKFIRNKLEFNLKLKKFLLSQLSSSVVCNRLFCPACTNVG